MISFTVSGSTAKTQAFLQKMKALDLTSGLEMLGQRGVAALQAATPVDTGLTANSWSYEITKEDGRPTITWINTNTVNGVNVAILIQYGHGTGGGGYVVGRDFINPAIQPIFDEIANEVWKKVTSA